MSIIFTGINDIDHLILSYLNKIEIESLDIYFLHFNIYAKTSWLSIRLQNTSQSIISFLNNGQSFNDNFKFAFQHNYLEVVKSLLDNKIIDPNIKICILKYNDLYPITIAAMTAELIGNTKMVELLLTDTRTKIMIETFKYGSIDSLKIILNDKRINNDIITEMNLKSIRIVKQGQIRPGDEMKYLISEAIDRPELVTLLLYHETTIMSEKYLLKLIYDASISNNYTESINILLSYDKIETISNINDLWLKTIIENLLSLNRQDAILQILSHPKLQIREDIWYNILTKIIKKKKYFLFQSLITNKKTKILNKTNVLDLLNQI